MKVYQCIHKYAPHIPAFEAKYGITENSNITFNELRNLLIKDGYAAVYILKPALEGKEKEVFFTVWDYERLQLLWAKEQGLNINDLKIIKKAQIEQFKPDVFYNLSPFCDDNFVHEFYPRNNKTKLICWNSFIESRPRTYPLYDAHVTLHTPFVKYWEKLGLKAFELQPAVIQNWDYQNKSRPVDLLFYGQYQNGIFSNRNKLIEKLIDYKIHSKYNIQFFLQYNLGKRLIIKLPKFKLTKIAYPDKKIRKNTKQSIYGKDLYDTIKSSKIVINAYGDFNHEFKSNMRVFEAIGHGAFLISEEGNYPKGLNPGIDFYTYRNFEELVEKIEFVLNDWEMHANMAKEAAERMRVNFAKQKQWEQFQNIVANL